MSVAQLTRTLRVLPERSLPSGEAEFPQLLPIPGEGPAEIAVLCYLNAFRGRTLASVLMSLDRYKWTYVHYKQQVAESIREIYALREMNSCNVTT